MRKFSRSVNRILASLSLLGLLGLAGCVGEVDPLFSFNFEREVQATLPASATGVDTTFRFNISDAEDEFQSKETSRGLLESVTASRFAVSSNSSLTKFDSIEYYVSADTIAPMKIATISGLLDQPSFSFDPENIDLSKFFSQNAFNIDIRVISSRSDIPEMSLTFNHTFFVVATAR